MSSLGFSGGPGRSFEGFAGSVLEIGCGPLGFFELTENVDVLASDSLMDLYAAEIPYSTLGRRGSTNYVATPLQAIEQRFRFVVCSNVLDHSADWLEFLELLVNRVGPGGELLLVSDTRGYPMEGHTQVFSPEQAVRALRWLGLNRVLFRKDARAFNDHCDTRLFLRVAR